MDVSDAVLIITTKTVVTLLPLIPAYVLFKTLRSNAKVVGPFKGIKVQLGGAFAAYFLVFIALWQGIGTETDQFHYHTWRVTGMVKFAASGETPDFKQIISYMRPPELPIRSDGSFEFDVPVREQADGQLEWPQLSLEVPGFEPGIIHLYEPSNKPVFGALLIPEDYDRIKRSIALKEPVVIRSKADTVEYDPHRAEQPVKTDAVR